MQPHLGQKVTSKLSVPDDVVGDTHGHDVYQSLYFMDNDICVGHLDPVIHPWEPVWSNHLVNLFVNLSWKGPENIADKGTKQNKTKQKQVFLLGNPGQIMHSKLQQKEISDASHACLLPSFFFFF